MCCLNGNLSKGSGIERERERGVEESSEMYDVKEANVLHGVNDHPVGDGVRERETRGRS